MTSIEQHPRLEIISPKSKSKNCWELWFVSRDWDQVAGLRAAGNATCESFLKTLKYEEVYRSEYRDLDEAHASIGTFLASGSTLGGCVVVLSPTPCQ
jgi:hypothetical protein